MTIPHPTGSEEFARTLSALGAPAPWRLCDEVIGEILGDDGGLVLCVYSDTNNSNRSEDAASELAIWIIMAVNTLAGFKAETPK